jgi:hypothetical protein
MRRHLVPSLVRFIKRKIEEVIYIYITTSAPELALQGEDGPGPDIAAILRAVHLSGRGGPMHHRPLLGPELLLRRHVRVNLQAPALLAAERDVPSVRRRIECMRMARECAVPMA